MANIGAYSRHKQLAELRDYLFTNNGDGATPLVYTPAEQQAKALENLTADLSDTQLGTVLEGLQGAAALPTGAAITTGATTALTKHYKTSPLGGLIKLTLTNFAVGTSADGASLGIGASLITFPTDTLVMAPFIQGTFTLADDGQTTAGECGLGTTIASGAVAVLGGTATFENILGGTATSAFSDAGTTSTATFIAPATGTIKAAITEGIALRTTTPGLAVFFNFAAAWDAGLDAAAALTFSGTVSFEYRYV